MYFFVSFIYDAINCSAVQCVLVVMNGAYTGTSNYFMFYQVIIYRVDLKVETYFTQGHTRNNLVINILVFSRINIAMYRVDSILNFQVFIRVVHNFLQP